MAGIQFVDSFAFFSTLAQISRGRYVSSGQPSASDTIVSSGGPLSSAYLQMQNGVGALGRQLMRVLGSGLSSMSVGFHFNLATIPGSGGQLTLVRWMDSATAQCDIRISNAGVLTFTRNGTVLGTSATPLSQGVDYHLQAAVTIHNTTGALEVKINGTSVIGPLTSQNTRAGTNNSGTGIALCVAVPSNTGWVVRFSNLWMTDDSSFQGVLKIVPGTMASNGTYSDFTPLSSTNASNVDEDGAAGGPDDDTSYNSSSTAGHKDTFNTTGLTGIISGATIKGYQVTTTERVDDAGTHVSRRLLLSGGTLGGDNSSTEKTLISTFESNSYFFQTDPNTGSAFTRTAALAAQPGYKLVS